MTRNRYKNKKSVNPATALAQVKVSPAAQKVMDKIINGGPDYAMKNAIRVMTDSVKLAEEPEFEDLTLDSNKAVEVTKRWLKKYEARLSAAEKKSQDEFQQVYDDVRIKFIDELATPAFRKDVKNRLHTLVDRLMQQTDANKLEMALLLQALLEMKQLPWGLCGLILTVYNRAMQPAMQQIEEQDEFIGTLEDALREEGEETPDVQSLLQSDSKLARIGQKLFGKNPGLFDRLQDKAEKMLDTFENQIAEGKVPLALFTEEELMLPVHRIENEAGGLLKDVNPPEERTRRFFETVRQTVNEIMTPERREQMRKDLQATIKAWMKPHPEWAHLLQIELRWLEDEVYEDNPFILKAFFGQVKQMSEKSSGAKTKKRKR